MVYQHLDHIFGDFLDQIFENFSRVVELGTEIDFYEPNSELIINHKIESVQFEAIIPPNYRIFATFDRPQYDFFHLGGDFGFKQVFFEVFLKNEAENLLLNKS